MYPDDFVCPPPTDPASFLVTADNPNPVFDCKPGGDIVEFTVTLFNDNTTTNRNIRAFINNNHGTHAEFMQDANLDFNCIQTVSGGTEFWITNGNDNPGTPQCEDEKVFAMGPMGEQTVKFKVRYTGFDPVYGADFTVRVYSGASVQSSISKSFEVFPYIEINGGKYSNLYTSINNQWDINSPLYIKGDLEMDVSPLSEGDQYHFSLNKKLLFAEGKGLLINNVKTTMIGVEVGGCDNMWKGITVKSGKVFETDMMTSIADAQWAVSAQKGATVTLKNTKFINNNFAVRTDPTGSGAYNLTLKSNEYGTDGDGLKPAYSGQSPAPLGKGFAGLYLKDAGSVVIDADPASGSTNRFSNLKYGIVSNNTTLNVRSAVFKDITQVPKGAGYEGFASGQTGRAVLANKGLASIIPGDGKQVSFDNCHTGVETLGATSWVWRTVMTGMTNGIVTTNGLAIHDDNEIVASARGIELRYLPPVGFATPAYPVTTFGGVYSNTITMSGNTKARGISVSGVVSPTSVSGQGGAPNFVGGNINDNTVTMNSGAAATSVNDANLMKAGRNIISLSSGKGIYMGISDKNTLSCNRVSSASSSIEAGIYAMHPSRASVLCNLTDGTGAGLQFEGMLVGKEKADIGGNALKNNGIGLLYGVDAITGTQAHRGNRWVGNATSAQHSTPQAAQFSEYVVDNNEDDQFMPDFVDPFDWFEDISTIDETYSCGGSPIGYCISPGAISGIFPEQFLDEKIARGELSGSYYQAANNWLAQRRLYERLAEEGNPYPGNSNISNFLTSSQSNGIAGFANLQIGIRQLFAVSQSDRDAFQSHEEVLTEGLYDLAEVENQLHTPGISQQDSISLTNQRESIQQAIQQAADAKNTLLDGIATVRTVGASSLLIPNSSLPATTPYAANEKSVNDVLLRTVAQGVFIFSEQDFSTLKDIAILCPLSDGEAVLRARALLTLVEEEPMAYDDEAICNAERGISGARPKSGYLRVYPNPVNEYLIVEYSTTSLSEKRFLLWNALGQVVKTVELSNDADSVQVPLEGLTEGVYWYTLLGVEGSFASGKAIISR